MLFADVRGSTTLAETMSSTEFSTLMNRFYQTATQVLVETDAFIDKFVGDAIVAIYLPIFTGPNHARPAVQAALNLLKSTGHADPTGPWLPIGVGVHTGVAYFGTVGGVEGTFSDFTALGDNANVAARLCSAAGIGEAVISEAAYSAAGIEADSIERRELELKGKSEVIQVRVARARD